MDGLAHRGAIQLFGLQVVEVLAIAVRHDVRDLVAAEVIRAAAGDEMPPLWLGFL